MKNFICKRKIGIFAFCLCLVIGCIWKANDTYAKEDTKSAETEVKLEVEIGYDGNQVRYARKNRAVATITNHSSEAIDGVVKLYLPDGSENGVTVIEEQVYVESKEKEKVDLSFKSGDIFRTVTICLENKDGKKIAEKQTVVKKLSSSNMVYGILSKNADSLAYFMKETYGKDVVFEEKDFPNREDWLDIVDVLLVGDVRLSMLNKEQQVALAAWVEAGGTVVIGNDGKDGAKNLEVLGIKAQEENKELVVAGVSGTYYKNADLTIYPVKAGRGAYVVCSKSLEFPNTELVKKSACVAAVQKYYGETAELCLYSDYSDNGGYGYSSSVVGKNHSPLIWHIVVLLVVYVVLITIVLRFVLKKKDKLEYIWGFVPLCSVIFMGIVYAIGTHSRVSSVQMSYHTVVEYSKNSNIGNALTCVSFVNPSNETYELNIPDGMEVWNADPYEESVDVLTTKDVQKEMNISKGNGTVTFSGNTSFKKNNLYGAYEIEKRGDYDSNITCNDYEYKGTFTNNMGTTMKRACFLAGKRIYYIGNIENGETVEISENTKNGLLYNLSDLYDNIQARKWLSFGKKAGKYDLGYEYLVGVYNYLSSYSFMQRLTEPKLIYISESEDNRNRQWGVEDVVGYTINVLKVDVDYTQDEDTFVCDILSSKCADEIYPYIDNESSMEYVFTCQLGENETLTSLKYLEAPNDFGKDEQILIEEIACYPFDGKVELYNYDTAAFETVFVKSGEEMEEKKLAPYIGDENKIKIRLVVDTENAQDKYGLKDEYICEYRPIISATVKEGK